MLRLDICEPMNDVCKNDGTPICNRNGEVTCDCPLGFTGQFCENYVYSLGKASFFEVHGGP